MARRAQSYSDFHDAVKAVLGRNARSKPRSKGEPKAKEKEEADGEHESKLDETEIQSELDFASWYNDLEHELLESSHDDYTFVYSDRRKGS